MNGDFVRNSSNLKKKNEKILQLFLTRSGIRTRRNEPKQRKLNTGLSSVNIIYVPLLNSNLLILLYGSGSILGTMIGIFGTTFNNRLRMKELRDLVQDTASANGKNLNHAPIDVEALSKEISNSIKQQFAEYSSSALQSSHGEGEKRLQELLTQIQDSFVAQSNAHIQLETLLATHLTGEGNNKPLVLGERELTALLGVQKRDLTSLIVTSSILIPICTWALCKFLNL